MEGPGANGCLTILVDDIGEDQILPEAGERLREALKTWDKTLAARTGTGPAERKI